MGVLIATIYNSTGISGANFWIPVYILCLTLDPLLGFWLSLVSMLFGSIGGLIGHTRHNTINYSIVRKFIIVTIPCAITGALILPYINKKYLFLFFGVFAVSYGMIIFLKKLPGRAGKDNNSMNYNDYLSAAAGSILTGLISVGLGP